MNAVHNPPSPLLFTWASLEKWPWILMHDDTVTASPRAPLKDSSPCQKPPPPHAEPTVWGAMGQVVLNQHFKAAPLSIIRGGAPSSLHAGQWAERLRMTSPSLGVCCRHGWRGESDTKRARFLHRVLSISLIAFAVSAFGPTAAPGRHSCVECNLKFHHSVWSYVFCFFH